MTDPTPPPSWRSLCLWLHDSLPRCTDLGESDTLPPTINPCDRVATKAHGRGGPRYCDLHGAGVEDYPRAPAVRAIEAARAREPATLAADLDALLGRAPRHTKGLRRRAGDHPRPYLLPDFTAGLARLTADDIEDLARAVASERERAERAEAEAATNKNAFEVALGDFEDAYSDLARVLGKDTSLSYHDLLRLVSGLIPERDAALARADHGYARLCASHEREVAALARAEQAERELETSRKATDAWETAATGHHARAEQLSRELATLREALRDEVGDLRRRLVEARSARAALAQAWAAAVGLSPYRSICSACGGGHHAVPAQTCTLCHAGQVMGSTAERELAAEREAHAGLRASAEGVVEAQRAKVDLRGAMTRRFVADAIDALAARLRGSR